MSSWIQRISSFGMSAVPMNRRGSIHDMPPEIAEFKRMCVALAKDEDPEQAMLFFLEKVDQRSFKELSEYSLGPSICRVFRHFAHSIESYFEDIEKMGMALRFLNSGIRFYPIVRQEVKPDSKNPNELAIYRIIIKTAQTNDGSTVELILPFTQEALTRKEFVNYFFSGLILASVWTNVFVQNPVAGSLLAPIVNIAASQYEFSDVEQVQMMLERVTRDLNEMKLETDSISSGLLFVAYVIRNLNTQDFLPNLLPVINELAPMLESLSFLEPMISAGTSDPLAIWAAIDAICASESLPLPLLESALMAIYNSGVAPCPDPQIFSFNSFVPRIVELSDAMQKTLFETISRSDVATIADFFCSVQPLSQTGVNTVFLWQISVGMQWKEYCTDIVKSLLLDAEEDEVQLDLDSDEYFLKMAIDFVSQLSQESELAEALMERFYSFSMQGDEKALRVMKALMVRVRPKTYMEVLFAIIDSGSVPDSVMTMFTEVAGGVLEFNDSFFEAGGVGHIDRVTETVAGLDFMAALVCDGPIPCVDRFIHEHFDDLALKEYSQEQLTKLMMGVSQSSTRAGFLRIPSLCCHIENVPLKTPYDRYVYGSMATQYLTPTNDQIRKFGCTYISPDLALKVCFDPEVLPAVTDPLRAHYTVFQMHPSARKCSTTFPRSTTFSFWFYITELYDKSVLAKFPGGSIDMEANSYVTFGNKSVFCPISQWHLFTVCTIVKSQNHIVLAGYLDAKKMAEVNTTSELTIQLGDDHNCNAIWYVSSFLQVSSNLLEQKHIQQVYDRGPQHPTQRRMHAANGVRAVPYRGVLRYMFLFGGPLFIFGSMLDCQNQEHFVMLIQAAFNLLKLGAFDTGTFLSSVRYVFRRKQELWSEQAEQVIIKELEKSQKFEWNSLYLLLGDYCLMAAQTLALRTLANALSIHPIVKESLVFFHMMLDTYTFFKIDQPTSAVLLDSVRRFIQANHALLKKIPIVIASLSHYDTDSFIVSLNDDSQKERQRTLYELWMHDKNLFVEQTPVETAFLWVVKLNDELAVDLLHQISIIGATNPAYFDMVAFKRILPFLFLHLRSEKLWIAMCQFMTQRVADCVEDFMSFNVVRSDILPVIFELLTALIPFDLNVPSAKSLSFRLLHLVYSLIVTQSLSLVTLIPSVSCLCSLGFGERPPSQLPFAMDVKAATTRRPSRLSFRRGDRQSDVRITDVDIKDISDLDPDLSDIIQAHLRLNPVQPDQFVQFDIPEADDPKDWASLDSVEVTDFVAMIAAKTLTETSKDTSKLRQALVQLTVGGADVRPEVAIMMHRKVIMAVLDERHRMPNDSLIAFIDFLTSRIVEGWWEGSVGELLAKVAPLVESPHKFIPPFVVACLAGAKTADEIMAMAKVLSGARTTALCQGNSSAITNMFHLIMKAEIHKMEGAKDVIYSLAVKYERSELAEAVKAGKVAGWVSAADGENEQVYREYYEQIVNAAITNTANMLLERKDLTRKTRNDDLVMLMHSNAINVTQMRRAFRFEFFYRLNRCSLLVADGINALFRMAVLLDYSKTIPDRFSVVPAPHPFVVPMKMVPMVFPYEVTFQKVSDPIQAPFSKHFAMSPLVGIPELTGFFKGPLCLDGWRLPPVVSVGVASLITEKYNPTSPPFQCQMLMSPEPLSCVLVPTKEACYLILNAEVDSNGVVTLLDTSMICHYPLIEMGVYGLLGDSSLFLNHVSIRIQHDCVTVIVERTYLYRPEALDIFTAGGCHYTLTMDSAHRKNLLQKLRPRVTPSGKRGVGFAAELLSSSVDAVTKMWTGHQISNMDYLLYLNVVSGRSFNDYSQYPVFPWTISDYVTPLSDNLSLRDLTKPMGQLTEERAQKYLSIYEDTDPHYHYGTHYSYPAAVLHMLMRIEPNTVYNVMLHQGFDHPDRLFSSIEEMWRSASVTNQADVKELIPEMYVFPSMFENPNNLALPKRTDGQSLETVVLPTWSDNATEFVWQMRRTLESAQVAKGLPSWIDLIFGYKQKGQAAIDARNVFHPLSYADHIEGDDEQQRIADDEAIINFGQCPRQLFQKEHVSLHTKRMRTVANTPIKVCVLRQSKSGCINMRWANDELFPSNKLMHFVGSTLTALRILDGLFVIGNKTQYENAVFDISASALSSDGLYLTVASSSGYLLSYFVKETTSPPTLIPVSRTLSPGTHFHVCAVSSHYGLVSAASSTDLCLYDLTTGYLLRHYAVAGVAHIDFDETHDFIIVALQDLVFVLGLDFREIASGASPIDITSVAIGDSTAWSPKPFFATGHSDGSIILWEIDIPSGSVNASPLVKSHHAPIISILMFQNCRAIAACDSDGSMVSVSSSSIRRKLLKLNHFEGCALCGQPFRGSDAAFCAECGLPHCRNCIVLSSRLCTACDASKSIEGSDSLSSMCSSLNSAESLSFEESQGQRRLSGTPMTGAHTPGDMRERMRMNISMVGSFKPRATMAQIMTSGSSSSTISSTLTQDFSMASESIASDADEAREFGLEPMPRMQRAADSGIPRAGLSMDRPAKHISFGDSP